MRRYWIYRDEGNGVEEIGGPFYKRRNAEMCVEMLEAETVNSCDYGINL